MYIYIYIGTYAVIMFQNYIKIIKGNYFINEYYIKIIYILVLTKVLSTKRFGNDSTQYDNVVVFV